MGACQTRFVKTQTVNKEHEKDRVGINAPIRFKLNHELRTNHSKHTATKAQQVLHRFGTQCVLVQMIGFIIGFPILPKSPGNRQPTICQATIGLAGGLAAGQDSMEVGCCPRR